MQQEIELKKNVRLFRKHMEWEGLYRDGRILSAGDIVSIGAPQKVSYDHRTLFAVPVCCAHCCGQNYFLLVEELDMPELVQ